MLESPLHTLPPAPTTKMVPSVCLLTSNDRELLSSWYEPRSPPYHALHHPQSLSKPGGRINEGDTYSSLLWQGFQRTHLSCSLSLSKTRVRTRRLGPSWLYQPWLDWEDLWGLGCIRAPSHAVPTVTSIPPASASRMFPLSPHLDTSSSPAFSLEHPSIHLHFLGS